MGKRRGYVPESALAFTDKSGKIQSTWYKSLMESHDLRWDTPVRIGIDEVGVGSWYGPMVVVGVVNLTGWRMDGIKDSKQIKKETVRRSLASEIQHNCLWVSAFCHAEQIDDYGVDRLLAHANRSIANALIAAVRREFSQRPITVILDGEGNGWDQEGITVQSIPKADATEFEVSAASIVAKVLCDDWIHQQCQQDPSLKRYDLDSNKGYGAPAHRAGLAKFGPTTHHRKSYRGVCTTGA